MRAAKHLVFSLVFTLSLAAPTFASTGEISSVIESFITKRFPHALSHFWVVNSTDWGAEDEVVVDVNTIVTTHNKQDPTEKRFLLLIVSGKLVGTQSIPLGVSIECQPDEIV